MIIGQIIEDGVTWPAVLSSPEDEELVYINNAAVFESWTDDAYLQGDERLIDSAGQAFSLKEGIEGEVRLGPAEPVGLDELNRCLRAHAATLGLCCVAKLSLPSFSEAMAWVGEMEDQSLP